MPFILLRDFTFLMQSMFLWAVIKRSLNLWSEHFGIFLIMLSKEVSIPWGFGFMGVSLARPEDILTLDITRKEEDQGRKEISVRLRLFYMKNKRTNSCSSLLKDNVHQALQTQWEEFFCRDRTQIIHPWQDTLTSQQQREGNKQARY